MPFLPSRETQGYANWWTENSISAVSWNQCFRYLS